MNCQIFLQKYSHIWLLIATQPFLRVLNNICVCAQLLSHVWLFETLWDPGRLHCPWNFPGKNTGACCHFLLQGIFPTQGSNLCLQRLLFCRRVFPLRKMFSVVPYLEWTFLRNGTSSRMSSFKMLDLHTKEDFISIQFNLFFCFCLKFYPGKNPRGGHGNPLKYSCLENPMDKGVRWSSAHRVTEESDTTEAT